jgi:hypothetical protein
VALTSQHIRIILWQEEDFFHSSEKWFDLLERSSADRLFMSWEWMSSWWKVYADPSMHLKLVVAIDKDSGVLLGIAPIYLTELKVKGVLKIKRLQFIGNCWNGKPAIRTELLEFIVDQQYQTDVVNLLWSHISEEIDWDEFAFKDLLINSATFEKIQYLSSKKTFELRITDRYLNYHLILGSDFTSYLKSLSQNTRRRIFNKRKELNKSDGIKFLPDPFSDIESGLAELNRLHQARWHKLVFSNQGWKFHRRLIELISSKAAVQFSSIYHHNNVISIQYNFLLNNQKYNIQAGFDTDFNSKLPLGYLHFGFEIEHCYDQNIEKYHFLAGEGKNTDYKKQLTDNGTEIVDCILIRHPVLRLLYYLNDFARSFLQKL